ncbi:MAG TPA: hypothetical protein VJA94_00040 [Candidatus Angelobacter sp.]
MDRTDWPVIGAAMCCHNDSMRVDKMDDMDFMDLLDKMDKSGIKRELG